MARLDPYVRLLVQARQRQLNLAGAGLRRLMLTYDNSARAILREIVDVPSHMLTPAGAITQAHMAQLLTNINQIIQSHAAQYSNGLTAEMLQLAQAAADRQATVAGFAGAPVDPFIVADLTREVGGVQISFSRVAESTVQTLTDRYERDGLRLSDRIHNLSEAQRQAVENAVLEGVAQQYGTQRLANELRPLLSGKDAQTPRYVAERIARTEINNAHREATLRSTTDSATGQMQDWLVGVQWLLSNSHVEPDICDVWASYDSGLGPGVYMPDACPVDHPNGLCSVVPLLKGHEDAVATMTEADVSAVPASQIEYYAGQGDLAAAASVPGD